MSHKKKRLLVLCSGLLLTHSPSHRGQSALFCLIEILIQTKLPWKRSRIVVMCMYGPVLPSLLMHAARYHSLYWKFAPATKNLCRLRSLALDSYWMVLFCCPFRAQTDPYVSMLRLQKLHSCSPVQPMGLGRSIDMKEQMIFPPQKRSFSIFLMS